MQSKYAICTLKGQLGRNIFRILVKYFVLACWIAHFEISSNFLEKLFDKVVQYVVLFTVNRIFNVNHRELRHVFKWIV